MMTDAQEKGAGYVPISCEIYSEYELAILRRQRLRLVWREDNILYESVVVPLDLQTQDHQEYLIGRSETGEAIKIRLDRIRIRVAT